MSERPTIVCLCGSTKFKEAFEKASMDETFAGKIVLSVGAFGHHLPDFDMSGDLKKKLDELHLRKIELADEVLFLNVGDYLGESSLRELQHARFRQKKVRFLETPTKWQDFGVYHHPVD